MTSPDTSQHNLQLIFVFLAEAARSDLILTCSRSNVAIRGLEHEFSNTNVVQKGHFSLFATQSNFYVVNSAGAEKLCSDVVSK